MMNLPLNIDYSGKVVVVTGAGGLICGAMARAFAQSGAKVAALDLNEEAVKKLAEELKAEGIPHSEEIEWGIMIETPAAALISDRLAPMVDFFSIGTNDLTQYTLAMDRQNRSLSTFFDPHHEAVLRLIELTVENAHRAGKWVGICGELGADEALTERFLRMGVDELSVSPAYVLRLRDRIRNMDLSK